MNNRELERTFLSHPKSYPEPTSSVELRETHISEVYLTDQWAYKVKKPIKLPFLDYASVDARLDACQSEIELNRRFSHRIYDSVVAITQGRDGRLEFDGDGPVIDYAVKMRRIPDNCLMDRRLQLAPLPESEVERLCQHLGSCLHAAPQVYLNPGVYALRLRSLLAENRASLVELSVQLGQDPGPWHAIAARQILLLRCLERELEQRVQRGRIIEGHGDLRPEHVVFEEKISLIDGVEFNRGMRTLDLADELSFLSTECALLGHAALGQQVRDRVLEALGDQVSPELLALYESHRALVRAKVTLLKISQTADEKDPKAVERAKAYRLFAEQQLRPIVPGFTFIVAGAMGSGKTTVARALKQEFGMIHLESDTIRRELLGRSPEAFGFGAGNYTFEARLKVYERLRDAMLQHLELGMPVIVDASMSEEAYLNCITNALQQSKQPYLIIACECADEVAMARIKERMRRAASSSSEARPELYQQQKSAGDWSFSGHPHCRLQTDQALEPQWDRVYEAAKASLDALGRT